MSDFAESDGTSNAPGCFPFQLAVQVVENTVARKSRLVSFRRHRFAKGASIVLDRFGEMIVNPGKDRRIQIDGSSSCVNRLKRHMAVPL